MENKFEILNKINVSDKVEKKDGLTYLSWAWAWGEFLKVHPDANYEIDLNDNHLPYFADECGAMVYTKVTAGGSTKMMWLPVMDGKNKAMKKVPYTYPTKYGDKTVEAFTMFDVNKAVMRCLVKNLAMFGFALYIYAGEDLPESEGGELEQEKVNHTAENENFKIIMSLIDSATTEIITSSGQVILSQIKRQRERVLEAGEQLIELFNLKLENLGIEKYFYFNEKGKIEKLEGNDKIAEYLVGKNV